MVSKKEKKVVVKQEEESGDDDVDENGAGPSTQRSKSAKNKGDEDEDEDMEDDEDPAEEEEETETKPSLFPTEAVPSAPPRILLTTSPHATQITHAFMKDLRSVFPGGEVYKRLKGRGFELGRIARWAAKREFKAMIVVNEDHKTPSKCWPLRLKLETSGLTYN
jgi:ribosome production factor 1